jgi:hypothetical protein
MLVLADPASIAALADAGWPEARWSQLARHHEVVVLLLTDPLEQAPPRAALPFLSVGDGTPHRVELDLATAAQRARWRDAFGAPVEAALAALPSRGVRVRPLSTDEDSDAWLPLFGGGPVPSRAAVVGE